jgi:hypothetical protein
MGALVMGDNEKWKIGPSSPDQAGWKSYTETITIAPSTTGIVASIRAMGDVTIYTDCPAQWFATNLVVFGLAQGIRAEIFSTVLTVGTNIEELNNVICDQLEIEIQNPPVFSTGDPMRMVVMSRDQGSIFWEARFVELLNRFDRLEDLLLGK